jgi:hypothetical protein
MIQLIEIIRRSEQGVTRPFVCRGDDGALYYVKGAGAGWKALIAEWVAGSLARHLPLPVPPFIIAEVPRALVRGSVNEDIGDLGEGPVFASRAVLMAEELRYEHVHRVPLAQQAWTLLFDCWVINGDRTLSEHGGNPNVLWTPGDGRMHLIDHNLAFEDDPLPALKSHHVFGAARQAWDAAFQAEAKQRMRAALRGLPAIWQALPEEWLEFGCLTLPQLEEMLWRFDRAADILWS